MSAFVKQETCINDQAVLLEALKNKGYADVEVHEKAENLYGYHGDKREETCEIIVRRKHVGSASNDIGFKKDAKGNYQAIISQYDRGKHNKAWMDGLLVDYGTIKAKKIAKKNGWSILNEKNKDGKNVIKFTVKA